ncbi:MAG: ACP S-malonyltransferase [Sandaracinaceae bacterium]|nr:ACP S-malonyltransferase [Sandaracinaceae bacterium]
MNRVAFIFPGQGSQKVGMGQDAHQADSRARDVFERADAALGFSLTKLCFEGPEEELRLTANTQPAILTVSYALYQALGETPDWVAGHSLGEWSANVVAGALAFEDAVRLVRKRGQYMQEAVPVGEGAMAAVLRAERALVDAICEATEGVVEAVNYNSPGQIVIAGAKDAVERASERLKEEKARVMPLPVSAPFHCSLMRPAEERLSHDLEPIEFGDPEFRLYANVTAEPIEQGSKLKEALTLQVSRPVRWEELIRRMIADGAGLFVEIGPGRVLTGLVSRIDKNVNVLSVQSMDDLEAARTAIAEFRAS